jgi:hypothetical protein
LDWHSIVRGKIELYVWVFLSLAVPTIIENSLKSVLASRLISITDMEMLLIISENGEIVFSQTSSHWEGEKVSLNNSAVPENSLIIQNIYYRVGTIKIICAKLNFV